MSTTTQNIFEKAKIVGLKKGTAKSDKKSRFELEGLEMSASIKVVREHLDALAAFYDAQVKTQMKEIFVVEAMKTHTRPDNFKGEEGEAEASCELRKRSTASGLAQAEIDLCEENGIPLEVLENMPSTPIINPEYATDTPENKALLERVSKALTKVAGLPSDFIQMQQGTPKTVVNDDSMRATFQVTDRATLAALMGVIMVPAVKAKLLSSGTETVNRAFGRVAEKMEQKLREPFETPKAESDALHEALKTSAKSATKPTFKKKA
jgi:hypothetical protein